MDMIDRPLLIQLSLQPLSLLWMLEGGAESSNPLITWLVPLTTNPHLEALQEAVFLIINQNNTMS